MTKRSSVIRGGVQIASGLLFFVGIGLTGCGGHSSSSSSSYTSLTATIDWPALSPATRDITGVSTAAVACIISTTSGNTSDGDPVDFTPIIRTTNADGSFTQAAYPTQWNSNSSTAYTVPYSPQQIRQGMTNVQVRFYAQLPANPTSTTGGVENEYIASNYEALATIGNSTYTSTNTTTGVATTSQLVPINVTGSTTDLGVITINGSIQSIAIPAITTVNFGSTTTIPVSFTALNSQTTSVTAALGTGAATFSSDNPSITAPTVNQNGTLVGTGLGMITDVVATVDPMGSIPVSSTPPATVECIVGSSALTTLPSGVQYRDTVTGTTGTAAALGQSVQIAYVGYFSNDPTTIDSGSYTTFDTGYQSSANPLTATLGVSGVLQGFADGMVGMLVGGTRIIVVPAALGYGSSQVANVPGNSTLIYTVTRIQ